MLAPTDAGVNDKFVYTRRAAARLAAALDAELVLYDRSAESWADSPHHEEVCDAEGAQRIGADELVKQFAHMSELGAPKVSAYLASIPTFGGVADAIRRVNADVIATPARMDHPKLFDRFQLPDGDLVEHLEKMDTSVRIVIADPDGSLELA